MSANSPRTLPLKALLGLTAAVLLVHLALLRGMPMSLGLSQPPPLRAFTTRTIELATAAPTPAQQPTAPPIAAPRPHTPPAATKARPEPTDIRRSSADEAAQAPAAVAEAENPSPAATSPDEKPAELDPPASAPRPPREDVYAVSAYRVPGSARFKYAVQSNKFPFNANAELRWQQDGESYEAQLEISLFGLARVQTSRGEITPEGLAPIRFSDKSRSEVAAHFNREKGKVTFSANTPDAPLLAGAQDRLSIMVQLAGMIAGDPAHYPQATTIAIQTIGPRDADTWLFTVGVKETLTLPGGQLATLKLVRNPRQEFDQKVELWLAPALGYLPARIRVTEPNGDVIDQKWLATEGLY